MRNPIHMKKEVITFLNKELSLPFHSLVQDWDIEMADSKRIFEFITYLKNNTLSSDVKVGLMALIISSIDDYLNENNIKELNYFELIHDNLLKDIVLYTDLIKYWSVEGEVNEDHLFKVSKYLLPYLEY